MKLGWLLVGMAFGVWAAQWVATNECESGRVVLLGDTYRCDRVQP